MEIASHPTTSRQPVRFLQAIRRAWPVLAANFLLWMVCAIGVWAEEVSPKGTPGALLLEGNRVIEGRIKEQGDTYAVDQPAGVLVVSREQVRFVGTDLHSIYVHLQDELPQKPSADDHVDLARWCLGYKLHSEARFELQAALEAEPDREDVRRNLVKLDTLLRRPQREPEKVKPETPAERLAKGTAGITLDVETLGGLSRESGQEFTRKIQPILMHNCTASACHGPRADNKFKLDLVRQGAIASRSTTEKNLLRLLAYVDQDSPKESEIWKLIKTNHGAAGRSIFAGTKGSEQKKIFQSWLVSLSNDQDQDGHEIAKAKSSSPFGVQQASHAAEEKPRWRKGGPRVPSKDNEPPTPEVRVSAPESKSPASATSATKRPSVKSSTTPVSDVEPIVSEERPEEAVELPPEDPFNPDEFNSQQRIKKKIGQ